MIYDAIRQYGKVGHNQLWRILRDYFKKTDDSFSNKTFEKTLLLMVNDGLIFKEVDKNSKLGRTWYYLKWDLTSIKESLIKETLDDIAIQENILKMIEENYPYFDNYDRASDFVNFEISISIIRLTIGKLLKIYPKNRNLNSGLIKIQKLRTKLEKLLSLVGKEDKKEINQLIIQNQHNKLYEILHENRSMIKA